MLFIASLSSWLFFYNIFRKLAQKRANIVILTFLPSNLYKVFRKDHIQLNRYYIRLTEYYIDCMYYTINP